MVWQPAEIRRLPASNNNPDHYFHFAFFTNVEKSFSQMYRFSYTDYDKNKAWLMKFVMPFFQIDNK